MLKSIKRTLIAVIFTALFAVNVFAANPKREFRSTWLTTVWAIDWPNTTGSSSSAITSQKNEMITYLDQLKGMNLTAVCFQVRSLCDAMYESSYEPWSSALTGTRGKDPGWDPLAFVVEECHKRGLECYAWVNPFRWSTGTAYNTSYDQEWDSKGWLLNYGSYTVLNPGLAETRQHSCNVLTELLTNYRIDGVIFDDYFYPNNIPESSSADDYTLWKNSGSSLNIGDWRRENVHKAVREFHAVIQELRPDVRFGIAPAGVADAAASDYGLPDCAGSDWQYDEIFSDPLKWLYEGTIDFMSPQIYWNMNHSTNPFGEITEWWSNAAYKFGRHHYASHSISALASSSNTASDWAEYGNQIKASRNATLNNASGVVFYSTKNINGSANGGVSGLGDYLKKDLFSTPALSPEITWTKNAPSYSKVSNLSYNSGNLSWTAVSNGNAIIKYTVYAVPMTVTVDNAKASNGDGFDGQYLVDVTYTNSYSIPSDKQTNYWYAVCVFDGYGKEHTAAIVNYPEGESEKTTLIAPINGAVADWNATFSWSNVSNATYTLEVATDNSFSSLKYSVKNLTANSTVLDLSSLESSTVYYWRVITSQQNRLDATSDVATFKTSTRPLAPQTTLLAPATGTDFEDDFTFSWTAVDCESYTLEVSTFSDFSTIKYSKTLISTSHEMTISLLGKGSYYWRVKTSGKNMEDAYSAVRTFNITKVIVGNYENGYSIKTDIDSYADVKDMSVKSLWFRSVAGNYNNYYFSENGSFNRGFCATTDYVYVSGRLANDTETTIYVRKIDAKTGEIISDVFLGDEAKVNYYPCNDVIKDSNENICVTNLTTNIGSTPLKVFHVDMSEDNMGALTEVASVTMSGLSTSRVDHAAVTGDVVSGNFSLYAAVAKSKIVIRWKFVNGIQSSVETCTLSGFYPSSASSLGIAPRVIPIDDDSFLLIGGDTALSRYSFSTGKMTDSFANKSTLAPIGMEGNGGAWFAIGDKKFIVYPYSDYNSTNGYTFNLTQLDENMSFSSMELLWNMPKRGIGSVNSTTFQADADYVATSNNSGIVYLFVPGCGICAYQLTDTSYSGVDMIDVDGNDIVIRLSGSSLLFGAVAEDVSIYNVQGMEIAHAIGVSELESPATPGVYVVKAIINGVTHTQKIIIC